MVLAAVNCHAGADHDAGGRVRQLVLAMSVLAFVFSLVCTVLVFLALCVSSPRISNFAVAKVFCLLSGYVNWPAT